jgi:TP901 family phage tail tape measure protein
MEKNAISLRYANYDLASTFLTVSAAITAAGAASTVAFAQQERAFTNVERTAEGSIAGVQNALLDLSTTVPVAFTDLAGIATLGNQLGIAAEDVVQFTEVVSAFSTVTGITAEASAQAFGRIGNIVGILPSDFDNLASTITYVGRTSAATEQQIIGLTERLGATASRAGFTASEIVGLSGAVASLGIAPERAQGVFETYFNTLNEAVAEGGERLEYFAQVTGLTTQALSDMVRSGQGLEVFERFISTISGVSGDTVQVTQAMEALGLTGLRVNEVIPRIAGNMNLFRTSLQNANSAWSQNSELNAQMALILDDLSSKWTIFLNAVTNAAAVMGGAVAPALKGVLDVLTPVLVAFAEFASTDFGQGLLKQVAILGGLVAGYLALRGVIALATGSFLALRTASAFMGGSGLYTSVVQLGIAMGFLSRNAQTGAVSMVNFSKGLGAAARSTGIVTLVIGLINLFTDLGGTVQWVGGLLRGFGGFLSDAIGDNDIFSQWKNGAEQIRDAGQAVVDWGKTLPSASDYTADFDTAASGAAVSMEDLGQATDAGTGSLGDLGNAAGGAAAEVRTLTDYANDLASVWDRAFEIRFSGQQTLDTITTSLDSIRDAAEEARRNMASLQAEISGIQNDINAQQYFLGIAIEYKDSARAEAIQANLAKLQANLADKTADLNDAQSANSKELTGNSKAAINNRKTITDLVAQYQAHIRSLASSGLSSDELARRTEELRQDFITQATQLGYNRGELALYEQSFYDVATAINAVPRNITVAANVDPALQALAEFRAKGVEAGQAVGNALSNAFGGGAGGFSTAAAEDAAKKIARRALLLAEISVLQAQALTYGLQGNVFQAVAAQTAIAVRNAILASGGYASGGFTGRGGKYEPAGVVHRGEYVVPKEQVNQRTGLPYANALGQLQKGVAGRSGYAGGGFVRGGGTFDGVIRQFGPMAAQQLMMALTTQMTMDGSVVGKAVNRSNENSTALGSW